MIKAILIDDEQHCRETLAIQLERYCPEVQLMAACSSAAQGLQAIAQYQPEVVFLDVEMPHMNGFEMLQQVDKIYFEVIFTTGYDSYAIKAIRFSALDYLLTPVDKDELKKAVAKISAKKAHSMTQQLDILLEKLETNRPRCKRLPCPLRMDSSCFPCTTSLVVNPSAITRMSTLRMAVRFSFSRTLKEIDELLEGHCFLRLHHSHVVNLEEVARYIRGEGGYVIMSDNSTINVSRSRKEALLKRFG